MRQDREELLRKLEAVAAGLAVKEAVEQSSCFVFKDKEVITFNDEIACRIECKVGFDGAVAAKPLLELLNKLAEKEVDVGVNPKNDGEVLVKGKGRRSGVTLEQEIMLPIDAIEEPEDWNDLDPEFGDAIGVVQECAGKDPNNFELTCVHITPEYVETSDNYQIARYPIDTGIDEDILVKKECIKHIVGLGMTEMSKTDKWLHFRNPAGLVLSMRRDKGDFVEVDEVLDTEGSVVTLPGGLAEAIDKAEIFSAENSDGNTVRVRLVKDQLQIKGKGANGWYEERKDVKWSGEPFAFNIKPKLLVKIVQQTNDCIVAPGLLKIDNGKFVYVTCTVKADE